MHSPKTSAIITILGGTRPPLQQGIVLLIHQKNEAVNMAELVQPINRQSWPTNPPSTMEEAMDFMLAALPMFTRIGAAALKPGLDNILTMCARIGNPQHKFRSIHVAGTNGKGSTSHALAAILQSAGYKVGLHTSPHLKRFNERVKVNGQEISNESLLDFISGNWGLWEEVRPSFFEYGVLVAFDTFAKAKVDIAIIEVGLGGRLDSTNILTPILSVITNISLDHTDLLGHNTPQIAAEKAGIIKPAVPVVIGEYDQDTLPVFSQSAAKNKSEIVLTDQTVLVELHQDKSRYRVSKVQDHLSRSEPWLEDLSFELKGHYQQHNLATILTAVLELRKQNFRIEDEQIRSGLQNCASLTGLKGRWQTLQTAPLVIADTGHNEAGIRQIIAQLKDLVYAKKRTNPATILRMVFGMVADKDVNKVLTLLPTDAYYYFCQAQIPRALDAEVLRDAARDIGLKGIVVRGINEALMTALAQASHDDVIFVGGSTYVVAELEGL